MGGTSRRWTSTLSAAALLAGLVVFAASPPASADGNDAPGAPVGFRAIAAGEHHTCSILDNGTVKCWGRNAYGQLGYGDENARGDAAGEMGSNLATVDLGFGATATALAAGYSTTCAVLDDGRLKCWGFGGTGDLGQGSNADIGDDPGEMGDALNSVYLGDDRNALAVTAGFAHVCAILDTHAVKCWGYNANGQLGLGDTNNRGDNPSEMGNNLPIVDLGPGRTAIAISAGDNHTCALLDNHTVKCWGVNSVGQLGLGDASTRGDGAGEMGASLPVVDLGTGRTATAISAGGGHTCAILDDSSVKCWGQNNAGQLGQGTFLSRGESAGEMGNNLPVTDLGTGRRATAITAGYLHTCAILDNDTVKCWGENGIGQLGRGHTNDLGDAAGEMGDNLQIVDVDYQRRPTAILGGGSHTCLVLDDRSLECWGSNVFGQLGQGDTAPRGDNPGEVGFGLPSIDVGPSRTVVPKGRLTVTLETTSRVDVGETIHYRVTVRNTGGIRLSGITLLSGDAPACDDDIGGLVPLQSTTVDCAYVANADDYPLKATQVIAVSAEGTIGISTTRTTTVDLVNGPPPAAGTLSPLVAGYFHACVALDDGTLKCWGWNSDGQLGTGDTLARGDNPGEMGDSLAAVDLGTGRTPRALAGGRYHACAVLDNGQVKCWGSANSSAGSPLGYGDANDRGDGPGEMGNALPAVSLGTGRTATALAAGDGHTCALLDNGSVKCWGRNDRGQLGLGNTTPIGATAGQMGDALPAVDLGAGRTAIAISAGERTSCALLDNGQVKCWGDNQYGQLGIGNTAHQGDGPGEMGNALQAVDLGTGRTATAISSSGSTTCAVLDDGSGKCWGFNNAGQLGQDDFQNRGDNAGELGDALEPIDLGTRRTVVAIDASRFHTCAVLDNATLKCWGANGWGELGQGDIDDRGDDPGELGDTLRPIDLGEARSAVAVAAGEEFTCVLLDNGAVKCWGYDTNGQSGQGDVAVRGNDPGEMGDALAPVDLGTGRRAAGSHETKVGVTVTADQGSVVAGADIDYHLTVTNTGGVRLRDIEISAPDVPDCEQPVPDLAAGASSVVNCSYTTNDDDVPQMTNQVLVTTGNGVSKLSGTRRTRVLEPVVRPDAQLRLGAAAFIGDGVYNTTGASQTRSTTVPNLGTATFTVRVQNDGNVPDDLTVLGQPTTSRYTVTYKVGPTNVTSQVVAGTYTLDDLAPGGTADVTVTIKAKAGTPVNNIVNRLITVTSATDTAVKDTVKASVKRR